MQNAPDLHKLVYRKVIETSLNPRTGTTRIREGVPFRGKLSETENLKKNSLSLSLSIPTPGIAQSLLHLFAVLPFLSVQVSLRIRQPYDVSIWSWIQMPSLQVNSPEGITPALSKLNFGEIESCWISISPVSTVCLAENAQECKNSPHMCTAAHLDSSVLKLKYSCFVMLCYFFVYRAEI